MLFRLHLALCTFYALVLFLHFILPNSYVQESPNNTPFLNLFVLVTTGKLDMKVTS